MDLVIGISFIGIMSCAFLGIQFLLKGNSTNTHNFLLGILFILMGIRIGKLPVQELTSTPISDIYFNLMHASYLAFGPIVLLYIRSIINPASKKQYWFHFVPSFVSLIGAFTIRGIVGEYSWLIAYWVIQIHPLPYSLTSVHALFTKSKSRNLNKTWFYSIGLIPLVLMAFNILYFTIDFPFYIVTTALVMVLTYLIILMAFNGDFKSILGTSKRKYENLNIDSSEIENLWNTLNQSVKSEKLYLNPALKISNVAEKVDRPNHLISMVINSQSGKNFSEYINQLRIEYAKTLLIEDPDKKILAVALDSGFSSLSVFNSAFKKMTGLSPTSYRSEYLNTYA